MKKIVMSTVVAGVLATNIMAEVKPYIGLGLQGFSISGSDISAKGTGTNTSSVTAAETSSDTGATVGLNGGLLIGDNGKLNFEYFSGAENSSELLETTVMSISYNYSFNNQGIRRGFYLGAGLSSVKTEIVDNILITQASESGTGLLLRGGYEYQTDNNLLLDIGFNMHTAEQDLKYDYKGKYEDIEGSTTTSLSNFGISLSYIF